MCKSRDLSEIHPYLSLLLGELIHCGHHFLALSRHLPSLPSKLTTAVSVTTSKYAVKTCQLSQAVTSCYQPAVPSCFQTDETDVTSWAGNLMFHAAFKSFCGNYIWKTTNIFLPSLTIYSNFLSAVTDFRDVKELSWHSQSAHLSTQPEKCKHGVCWHRWGKSGDIGYWGTISTISGRNENGGRFAWGIFGPGSAISPS